MGKETGAGCTAAPTEAANFEGPLNNYSHARFTHERMAEMRKVRALLKMSNEELLALLSRTNG